MRILIGLVALAVLSTFAAAQCEYSRCPTDDALGTKVSDDYANGHHSAVFEHNLDTGGKHRWVVRCD